MPSWPTNVNVGDVVKADHVNGIIDGATQKAHHVDNVTPSGTIDGVNAAFILPSEPNPAGSLRLYRNQLVQYSGTHFNLSVDTITFTAGNIPVAGDSLRAWYRHE